MSIKGTLDPILIDGGTSAMMRDSARYVEKGWWGVDDDHRPQIGPFSSKDACQKACDAFNSDDD